MANKSGDSSIDIKRLELGPYGTNAYALVCRATRDSVLVDAPADADALTGALKGTHLKYVLITHNHFDHTGVLAEVCSRLGAPVWAHAADARDLPVSPDRLLNNGDTLTFGKVNLEVLHTPGHTPGSLCFLTGQHLFCGDTIFPGGPGKTNSPEELRQIVDSITRKILPLPNDTRLYPGHGDSALLGKEKPQIAAFTSRPHDPGLCGDVLWM